jgi:hypothetical protein
MHVAMNLTNRSYVMTCIIPHWFPVFMILPLIDQLLT